MLTRTLFLLLTVLGVTTSSHDDAEFRKALNCGNCLDVCMARRTDPDLKKAYNHIYSIVQAVRGARLGYCTLGTLYAFDGSTIREFEWNQQEPTEVLPEEQELRTYQSRLAALLALTADMDERNRPEPYAITQFRTFVAYTSDSWSCGDNCDAAWQFLQQPYDNCSHYGPEEDYIAGACELGNELTNCPKANGSVGNFCGKELDSCQNRLLVVFYNGRTHDTPHANQNCTTSYAATVVIKLSYSGNETLKDVFGPGVNGNVVELGTSPVDGEQNNLMAVTEILKCMGKCTKCHLCLDAEPDLDEVSAFTWTSWVTGGIGWNESAALGDFIRDVVEYIPKSTG